MTDQNFENNSLLAPVILTGGVGERLWPLSRQHYSKQYLAFGSDQTMLQNTLHRMAKIQSADILIVCDDDTRFLAAEQIQQTGIDSARILLEPAGRNTAPAVAIAALAAVESGNDSCLLISPVDLVIEDDEQFIDAVATAMNVAKEGHLVVFGIAATTLEAGVPYVKAGAAIGTKGALAFDGAVDTSKSPAQDENCFHNTGMFMFLASKYLEELGKARPDILEACKSAFEGSARDPDFLRLEREAFLTCPDATLEEAVINNSNSSVILPVQSNCNDINSWNAVWENSQKDEAGNCEIGDVINIDGTGNYLHSDSRLVTVVGLENMIVVETKDAVFVAPRDRSQEVEKIIDQLKAQERSEYQFHRVVYRPWGKYDSLDMGDRHQVKRITVTPGAKLSVQKHHHRAEHWVVVQGTALVTTGEDTNLLTENQIVYIPLGEIHALENPGKIPLELIEVQLGSYLGEDDIVRFEDKYGRV